MRIMHFSKHAPRTSRYGSSRRDDYDSFGDEPPDLFYPDSMGNEYGIDNDYDEDYLTLGINNEMIYDENDRRKDYESKPFMPVPQGEDQDTTIVIPSLTTLLGYVHLAPASEIAYFYLQNTIGLPEETMWKITNEAGSVLGFSVANLEKKISLLRRTMNLSDDDVRTIITKQPSILHMSPNRNISPTILFLVRALDLSKDDLRTMIVAYPCILCYSIHNLRHKVKFFTHVMGFDMAQTRSLLVTQRLQQQERLSPTGDRAATGII